MERAAMGPSGGGDGGDGRVLHVYLLASVAAVGGLLFGYDTAVTSGAIGSLKELFKLDDWQEGRAVASVLYGCLLGSIFAGALTDFFGRKKVLLLAAVLFLVSAIGAAVPRNFTEFLAARVVCGFAVGTTAMLSPLYIAEIAPARIRGRLVSLNQLTIVGGMLVVYFVNAWIHSMGDAAWNLESGWRWMFASGALPAVAFIFLLIFVPESPRWLAKQGRSGEALATLERLQGPARAREELAEIERTIAEERGTLGELFRPGVRVALAIGLVLAVLQQVTGINAVLYYAPKLFKGAGIAEQAAFNRTVLVGLVNLVFTLVAIGIVDRLGRKPLLLLTSAGMGIFLVAIGIVFANVAGRESLFVIFTLGYVGSFAIAMGPVVWVVLAEIFPTRLRGRAMSVATAFLWAADIAVTESLPAMFEGLRGGVFFVYAAMCLVAIIFVAWCVPETKGKTLEEIERRWLRRRA